MDPSTDPSISSVLKNVAFFSVLDNDAIGEILSRCRRRRYRAGEAIFHEGDPGLTLYVILSGCVNIQRDTVAGTTIHLAQRGQAEAFGEMALIDGKPRMADAVTAAPTDLLMLDREAFVRCVEHSPRIAFGVMSYLADRLREAGAQIESRHALDVRGRLAEKLLHLAEHFGREEPSGAVRIAAQITQQALAEQIGTSRESVNRELSRMREVGAIRMAGRAIILTDQKKLRRYCDR